MYRLSPWYLKFLAIVGIFIIFLFFLLLSDDTNDALVPVNVFLMVWKQLEQIGQRSLKLNQEVRDWWKLHNKLLYFWTVTAIHLN